MFKFTAAMNPTVSLFMLIYPQLRYILHCTIPTGSNQFYKDL